MEMDHTQTQTEARQEVEEPPSDPMIGRCLSGRYRIVAPVARGGMCRVYEAVQAPLHRSVALKVMPADPADPSVERRFLLEAATTSRLTHPNTITVFDYGVDEGLLFFAMEMLRGSTLAQALKRDGRFSEARALHIGRQICRSLREAHAMGVMHRDLKPSNVFLLDHGDEKDFVKVLDFGLVKLFGSSNLSSEMITADRVSLGTPHFMSPEQARKNAPDHRSDIYSFGVVLFQMLAGRVPFDGRSEVDIIMRHLNDPPPTLREACPGLAVSPELEAVVQKCLAKSREERFQSMDELLSALCGLPGASAASVPPPLPAAGFDEVEVCAEADVSEVGPDTPSLGSGGDTPSRGMPPADRPGRKQAESALALITAKVPEIKRAVVGDLSGAFRAAFNEPDGASIAAAAGIFFGVLVEAGRRLGLGDLEKISFAHGTNTNVVLVQADSLVFASVDRPSSVAAVVEAVTRELGK